MKFNSSLKSQIILYLVGAFLVTSLGVGVAYFLNRKIAITQNLKVVGARLQTNAESQADQILPGLLVAEESASIPDQLLQMKTEEALDRIEVRNLQELDQRDWGSCETFETNPRIRICIDTLQAEVAVITEVGLPEDTIGYLVKVKSLGKMGLEGELFKTLGILLGSIALSFLLLLGLILIFVERHIRRPLMNLKTHLGPVLDGTSTTIPDVFRLEEMRVLSQQVQELIHQFENRKIQAALGEVAAQVAHDIRSPISVLAMIGRHVEAIPETERRLLESATARIRHITDDLLHRYKSPQKSLSHSLLGTPTFLLSVLDRILSEKRLLALEKNIQIDAQLDSSAADTFIGIDSHTFARVLSNLIDNCFEAFLPEASSKIVNLSIARDSNNPQLVQLMIRDNGRGIPKVLLPKIGTKGGTFNKTGGTGLGIFHARTTIESGGGRLEIESTEGQGTSLRILLKPVPAPAWFCGLLDMGTQTHLIIVDDDPSIHELIRARFAKVPQEHCQDDYLSVLQRTSSDSQSYFLMDNNLSSQGPTGLDLIQKFYISGRATLMTSDFESSEIQRRALQLGCKIIPKPLLPYLKLQMASRAS